MSEAKMSAQVHNAATAIAINQFTMAAVPAAITTAMEIVKLGTGPLKDKGPEFIANLVADLATKIIRRIVPA